MLMHQSGSRGLSGAEAVVHWKTGSKNEKSGLRGLICSMCQSLWDTYCPTTAGFKMAGMQSS